MLKWFTPFLFSTALLSTTLVADEPHRPLKVGDLVNLDLIGDAARQYASVSRISLDNAASPIPVLSMHAIVRSVDNESEVYIEHQLETVADAKRWMCTLKGTFPASAIDREPVLDLTPSIEPDDIISNATKPLDQTLRLRITDFSLFPQLKLRQWQMIAELGG